MFSSLFKNNFFLFLVAAITFFTLVSSPLALNAATKPKLSPQFDGLGEADKMYIQNNSSLPFKYIFCEGASEVPSTNQSPLSENSGHIFFIGTPDNPFNNAVEHNFEIMIISEKISLNFEDMQTSFPDDFCQNKISPLLKVNFKWKPGVKNTLTLNGNILEQGGSPDLYKLYQPIYGYYPNLYEKFSDLQPQSQKIYFQSTYEQGLNYGLDIERGLAQYCVNSSLVNVEKKVIPPGYTSSYNNFYLQVPAGEVSFAKPNFNFLTPCDTAITGEYERVLNIKGGTSRHVDLKETTDPLATNKKGIALTSFGPDSETRLWPRSEFGLCIDGIFTNSTMGTFPITPGEHIISQYTLSDDIQAPYTCPPTNQSLKLDIQANNSYYIKTFNTKGLDLVDKNYGGGVEFIPYQEGLFLNFIPKTLSICINNALTLEYTNFGTQSQVEDYRFYSLTPGTYDFNFTDNGNCNNQKYPKASLEIKAGKFTNAVLGQFTNPNYSISGLTFENSPTAQIVPDLIVNLGNFSQGDKTALKLRCTAGICKADNSDLPPSTDPKSLNYDIEFEFTDNFSDYIFKPTDEDFEPINDINDFTIDITLLNNLNTIKELNGNLINGIIFNPNCNSCLSKVTIQMILTKGEADKYTEIKSYFSNSPWQPASILQTTNNNSPITYTSSVNGSFRQFAFAGLPIGTAETLSNTGGNIPFSLLVGLVFISGCGVFKLKSMKLED